MNRMNSIERPEPGVPEDGESYFTPKRKLALALTALVYLAGAIAIYVFIDKQALRTALSLPLWVFAALLGLSLVNYVLRCWRWVVLARYLRFRVPIAASVLYYLAGFSLTATPGKAGEAVRLWFLKSGHDVPYARSVAIMLADRIIDMWALLVLAIISIAGFAEYKQHSVALAVVIGAVSIPILFPRLFDPLLERVLRIAPVGEQWHIRIHRLIGTMADLSSWRTYGLTMVPTVCGWLAECTALFLLLQHFGSDVSFLNVVFVFAFSTIVGAISMLPGGLGGAEATMVILLKALGVELDYALAATVIIRFTTLWFAVAIGVLLMPSAMNTARRAASQLAARRMENA